MNTFIYKAKDETGKTFTGVLEVGSKKELRKKLRDSGYFVVAVKSQQSARGLSLFSGRVSLDILIMFTHQLCSLIEAGLPILMALDILWRQISHPKMQVVISQIKNRLNAGSSISVAVDEFPEVFPPMYRNLLTVAETGGGLVTVLKKILEYLHNQKEFKTKINRATTYPLVVIVFSIVVVILMLILVVPTFQKVFTKLDIALPLPTRLIINGSETLRKPLFWILFIGIGAGVFFLYKKVAAQPRGRLFIDRFKAKIPIFGRIFYYASVGRFVRSLGLLLGGGLPATKSIEISKTTSINKQVENALEYVEKRIVEGAGLHEALRETNVFPSLLVEMVSVGEQSGTLTEMLEKSAVYFEEELEERVNKFLTTLEPLLIIFVGGIVLFVLLSIYLPIFSMWQGLV